MSVRFAAEAYRGVFMNFGMILQVIVAAGGMGTQEKLSEEVWNET